MPVPMYTSEMDVIGPMGLTSTWWRSILAWAGAGVFDWWISTWDGAWVDASAGLDVGADGRADDGLPVVLASYDVCGWSTVT